MYTREGKVAAATLEALGAQPAHGPLETWFEAVDGAEAHLEVLRGEPEVARQGARITTNVVLWAQPSTIVINNDAFEDLSDDQQRALREASAELDDDQSRVANTREDLQVLCGMGPKLVEATPAQREALEAAVEPVYQMIERSPGNAEAIAQIRELKGDEEPDTVDCGDTSEPASDGQTPGAELNDGQTPEAELEGTFRTTLTEDELANSPLLYDAGEVNDENWGELTLKLSDGRARYTIENNRAGWEASGTYTTDGDIIKLQFDEIGETWGFQLVTVPRNAEARAGRVARRVTRASRADATPGPSLGTDRLARTRRSRTEGSPGLPSVHSAPRPASEPNESLHSVPAAPA